MQSLILFFKCFRLGGLNYISQFFTPGLNVVQPPVHIKTLSCTIHSCTRLPTCGTSYQSTPNSPISPQTTFVREFFQKHSASKESILWLEREAARRKIHIHHAICGHGGERYLERAPVDGYNPKTKTISIPRMPLARMSKLFPDRS